MYQKGYGIIETQAPLHVGASAGEETGNLNLIFRDQFTLTGIIPGSSIRGRFRADMRQENKERVAYWYGREAKAKASESAVESETETAEVAIEETDETDEGTTEGIVKFEYASLLWLPVYCPNQPIVRVSCPSLLKRYQKLAGLPHHKFQPYSYYVPANAEKPKQNRLFFNLGFLPLKPEGKTLTLKHYLPSDIEDADDYLLLVVKDTEISMIHDMALYRQSRVKLKDDDKIVAGSGFFNVEALPERSVLVFPLALKETPENPQPWQDFMTDSNINSGKELYFGGLESIGFGRTKVTLKSSQPVQPTETTQSPAQTDD